MFVAAIGSGIATVRFNQSEVSIWRVTTRPLKAPSEASCMNIYFWREQWMTTQQVVMMTVAMTVTTAPGHT